LLKSQEACLGRVKFDGKEKVGQRSFTLGKKKDHFSFARKEDNWDRLFSQAEKRSDAVWHQKKVSEIGISRMSRRRRKVQEY